MVKWIDYAPVQLSLEEVTLCVGHKVLTEVDDISALIVGDPRGMLGLQLRPQPIYLLNRIISLLYAIFKLTTIPS